MSEDILGETSEFLDSVLTEKETSTNDTDTKKDDELSDSSNDSDGEYEEIERDTELILQKELEELNQTKQPRTQHEITDLPPVEPVQIQLSNNDQIEYLGHIRSRVNDLIVIQSAVISNYIDQDNKNSLTGPPALEEDSLICLEDRVVLGKVFEVFGPVREPYYSIRFNSADDIPENAIVGEKVYYVSQYCTKVFAANIYTKGCDASNEHNEEVPEHQQEYSDDEEERRAKANLKRSRKRNRNSNPKESISTPPVKRQMIQYDEEFAHHSVPSPPRRDEDEDILIKEVKVINSKTASDILNQEENGELKDNQSVIGFFEPLEPIEGDYDAENSGDVSWNKSVIISKK